MPLIYSDTIKNPVLANPFSIMRCFVILITIFIIIFPLGALILIDNLWTDSYFKPIIPTYKASTNY